MTTVHTTASHVALMHEQPEQSKATPAQTKKRPKKKRQKRTRKYASLACVNCRKAHAGCNDERPCKRCRLYDLDCCDSGTKRQKRQSGEVFQFSTNNANSASNQHKAPSTSQRQPSTPGPVSPLLGVNNAPDAFLEHLNLASSPLQLMQMRDFNIEPSPSLTSFGAVDIDNCSSGLTTFDFNMAGTANTLTSLLPQTPAAAASFEAKKCQEKVNFLTNQVNSLSKTNRELQSVLASVWKELEDIRSEKQRTEKDNTITTTDIALRIANPRLEKPLAIDVVVIFGWDYNIISCNQAFMRMAEISEVEVRSGKYTCRAFYPYKEPSSCSTMVKMLKSYNVEHVVVKENFRTAKGNDMYVRVTVSMVGNGVRQTIQRA